jgi:hypothetical protein
MNCCRRSGWVRTPALGAADIVSSIWRQPPLIMCITSTVAPSGTIASA